VPHIFTLCNGAQSWEHEFAKEELEVGGEYWCVGKHMYLMEKRLTISKLCGDMGCRFRQEYASFWIPTLEHLHGCTLHNMFWMKNSKV
jgi:hypothetical protein